MEKIYHDGATLFRFKYQLYEIDTYEYVPNLGTILVDIFYISHYKQICTGCSLATILTYLFTFCVIYYSL